MTEADIQAARRRATVGDRIRTIAGTLRQERDVQVQATARMMGAAAAIAQNHDRLIDEVVDMVEEDLSQSVAIMASQTYTVNQLQQQFSSFDAAKTHFNLKARSWQSLANKLNERSGRAPTTDSVSMAPSVYPGSAVQKKTTALPDFPSSSLSASDRLDRIEQQLESLQRELRQLVQLVSQLVSDRAS